MVVDVSPEVQADAGAEVEPAEEDPLEEDPPPEEMACCWMGR